MAEIKADTEAGGYRQINLNTGLNISTVVLLLGMVVWSVTVRNDVGYHGDRLNSAEASIKELRSSIDTIRMVQAQAETKLEGRLVGIEVLLREVINRLPDRRIP